MKKIRLEDCPRCGKNTFHHQIKAITLSDETKQPGYRCHRCLDSMIGGKDHKEARKDLQKLCANINGLLTPDKIKLIREKLNLTQAQAAGIFGGGINAFSRYERGETSVPRPLSHLLQLLSSHPDLLAELIHGKSTSPP